MKGVIAAGGPETAAAGAAMLRQGGNAVDAAVAAAFVSFIAEVGVVHLGGSGLAQIYRPATGESVAYDFFSAMPGLGRDGLPAPLDFERVTIDFGATTQDFYLGRASVAVPGNIIGLCQLAADYGRLPLPALLEPALALARDGVSLALFQADTCELLAPLYTHTPSMRRIFMRDGRLIRARERLFIPDLFETLSRLAEEGASLVRHGSLAAALVADQQANGGLIGEADLASYRVLQGLAIRQSYRSYEVLVPPPSSTGGILNAFSLRLLSAFDVGRLGPGSTRYLQLFYEVMAATNRARPYWERALVERGAGEAIALFLGDEFVTPYVEAIEEALRRSTGNHKEGTYEGHPNIDGHQQPRLVGNTSHLSVIDGDGLAIGLTTTAGESAGYVVPGTGFIPNNILGEADLNPNGFHQWPAGARIPTMMAPTIVRQNGAIRLVLGSGGSERIRSAIVQTLCNVLDFGMPLDEAVNAPRCHVEGAVLQCEAGYDEAAVAELERCGYRVNRWSKRSIYFGGAHSVAQESGGHLVAAGDNRRGGSAAVV